MRGKHKFICTIRSTSKYIYRRYAYITFNNDSGSSSSSSNANATTLEKSYNHTWNKETNSTNKTKEHVFMVALSIVARSTMTSSFMLFLTMKIAWIYALNLCVRILFRSFALFQLISLLLLLYRPCDSFIRAWAGYLTIVFALFGLYDDCSSSNTLVILCNAQRIFNRGTRAMYIFIAVMKD